MESEEKRNCKKHGDYVAKIYRDEAFSFATRCHLCGDDTELERKRQQDAIMSEEREKKIERQTRKAEIPPRFESEDLFSYGATTPKQSKALTAAEIWASDIEDTFSRGRCMLFWGAVGTGKTHLAIGCMKAALKAGKSALFIGLDEMLDRIRSCNEPGSKIRKLELLDYYAKLDLIVLDEVGLRKLNDFGEEMVDRVFGGRWLQNKPSIITTNLDPPELAEFVKGRVASRIRDGQIISVQCSWEDHRK